MRTHPARAARAMESRRECVRIQARRPLPCGRDQTAEFRTCVSEIPSRFHPDAGSVCPRVEGWFAARQWTPWPFQREAWAAFALGRSGLIQVATGAGKTYAAFGGALESLAAEADGMPARAAARLGLRVLYVTPLRAVSRDITAALTEPVRELGLRVRVECRTGDTSASVRTRQHDCLPAVLVTTPESLSLQLTREDWRERFSGLTCLIVDEWHELIAGKRGTQVELAAARLRRACPAMRTWALSATIANADEAMAAACGVGSGPEPALVAADMPRPVIVESLLPERVEAFPWAGHLGLSMLPKVLEYLDPGKSTLIFTNTRSQAELWYRAMLAARPELEPITALHHGSIDREERERVEAGVKSGAIRYVVATSSLDLGVDFAPVERVLQIGSPKGVARLVQRAGRASHQPGRACTVVCVPTHGLELVEIDAARRAIEGGVMEARTPPNKPLDVLAQHLVTCAMGGGFDERELLDEVRTAWSYRGLTDEEFEWTLRLVRDGGAALSAYERYKRVRRDGGRYRVTDGRLGRLHKLNVGTIVGSATLDVRFRSGKRLGSIEEGFVGLLRPGEKFVFAGRVLRFLGLRDLTAYVEAAKGTSGFTPHWAGTKLPISECLSAAVRRTLASAGRGERGSEELRVAGPILQAQARLSRVPGEGEVLAEVCRTREGRHLFLYPFEGRLVHAGLAALLALRLTRVAPATYSASVNDYGLELLTGDDVDFEALLTPSLFSSDRQAQDALESVNVAETAKLAFREIARVAGLVPQSYPGARVSGRQTQANSSLIYDVFAEFDPENLLLHQARREVLDRHFEQGRLARTLDRLARGPIVLERTSRPTPLAFPLIVERVSALVTGDTLAERLRKLVAEWDRDPSTSPPRRERRSR